MKSDKEQVQMELDLAFIQICVFQEGGIQDHPDSAELTDG